MQRQKCFQQQRKNDAAGYNSGVKLVHFNVLFTCESDVHQRASAAGSGRTGAGVPSGGTGVELAGVLGCAAETGAIAFGVPATDDLGEAEAGAAAVVFAFSRRAFGKAFGASAAACGINS